MIIILVDQYLDEYLESWRVINSEGAGEVIEVESDIGDRDEHVTALLEVFKISAELNAPDISIDRIMESITEMANRIVRSSFTVLFAFDEASELIMVKSYRAPDAYPKMISDGFTLKVGEGPAGSAFQKGEPLLVEDLLNNPLFTKWRHIAREEKFNAIYSFPIKVAGRPKFVLNFYFKNPHPRISEEQLTLLETFTHQAGVAFHRIRLDAERRSAEEKFRSLFESTLDGIYRADSNGVITLINQAGAVILGHKTPGEVLGKRVTDYWINPKGRDIFIAELMRKKSVKAYPMHGRRSDGTEIHLENTARLLQDEAGNIIGVEGIFRDVTEKKKLESELKQRLEELEKFHRLAVGRELKMIEFKEQIRRLEEKISDLESTK